MENNTTASSDDDNDSTPLVQNEDDEDEYESDEEEFATNEKNINSEETFTGTDYIKSKFSAFKKYTFKTKKRKLVLALSIAVPLFLLMQFVLLISLYYGIPVRLEDHVSSSAILSMLADLQEIAEQHNNARDDFSGGYMASVEYVENTLKQFKDDLNVYRQPFSYTFFAVLNCSLSLVSPNTVNFVYIDDYELFSWSPSGKVLASQIYAVDNSGCHEEDYASLLATKSSLKYLGFVLGSVAVIQDGETCSWDNRILLAERYGASSLIGYALSGVQGPLKVELSSTLTADIPAIGTTYEIGSLLATSGSIGTMDIYVNTSRVLVNTTNLFAETKAGHADSIVVVGAHLDSYMNPGINDNGSGAISMLEIAIAAVNSRVSEWLENKIVFAWWAASESGLQGSAAFIKAFNSSQRANIACNVNMDMLGSPNYIVAVLNGSSANASASVQNGCSKIQEMYVDYFKEHSIPYEVDPFHYNSDFSSFVLSGIPGNGAQAGFTMKSPEQRDKFGGIPYALADTCSAKECDTTNNIASKCLNWLAQANANVIQRLSERSELKQYLASL